MSRRAPAVLGLIVLAAAVPARAASYLLFFELQAIAGYSSAAKKIVFSSMNAMEAMQKSSLGFDYIQRFSGAGGDFAVLAVQGRLAYDPDGDPKAEPQLYNAYLKFKTPKLDIWLGHNRPKFGLSSALDNHAHLLQPLSMNGFGFDRDWGMGFERDTENGNVGASITTGSGMSLRLGGSYLFAGRIAKGVLDRDNYSVGFSVAYGNVLDAMGYHVMSDDPITFAMAGIDLTWIKNAWENRFEFLAGERNQAGAFVLFWRTGIGLLAENRLKLEAQIVPIFAGKDAVQFSAGGTYLASADWTLRAMAAYDTETKDARIVFQVYYSKGIRF